MEQILIIGAGAAGLMAGKTLSAQGYPVTFLEARDRIGGRIHTQHSGAFAKAIEHGAEFIHGNLPVTLGLLKEAGITYHELDGEMWHYTNGRFLRDNFYTEHWPLLIKKLQALKEDCSIREFLDHEFADDKYAATRQSVLRFVEGYDAADPEDVSAFSLRDEWADEEDEQYRIDGGYGRLMKYLQDECLKAGAIFHLSAIVREIIGQDGRVVVGTEDGGEYHATKVIITMPLNLLEEELIRFIPDIPEYKAAAQTIGSGPVIKFNLQFKEDFWKSTNIAKLDKLQMLLTDEEIPTWWTQYPEINSLLVGWLGGPPAEAMKHLTNEQLLEKALQSLSRIFQEPVAQLRSNLDDWHISNWPSERFTKCAYSYEKVGAQQAKQLLTTPINNTLYFAGEALYQGTAKGTVEAALCSGMAAAAVITGKAL